MAKTELRAPSRPRDKPDAPRLTRDAARALLDSFDAGASVPEIDQKAVIRTFLAVRARRGE